LLEILPILFSKSRSASRWEKKKILPASSNSTGVPSRISSRNPL
jgi:hypothetical protein